MPSRVFACLLALVLLCTGFSSPVTAEAASSVGRDLVALAAVGELEQPGGGPRDDHHPIDASAQACAETLADGQQALLMDGASAPTSTLCMARPRPYAASSRLAPYLDGPQRPPCAGQLVV